MQRYMAPKSKSSFEPSERLRALRLALNVSQAAFAKGILAFAKAYPRKKPIWQKGMKLKQGVIAKVEDGTQIPGPKLMVWIQLFTEKHFGPESPEVIRPEDWVIDRE